MSLVMTAVPFEELPKAWHRAAAWLKPAVARSNGRYDMASLYQTIKAQRSVLWLVLDEAGETVAALTTHVARYPLKDILAVDFIGGNEVDAWLALVVSTLDSFAASNKLDGLETCARHGWKPKLAALGWTQSMAWYERPVSRAQQG